jgi:lipoprotein-releasing system ATP-binding protein
MIEAKNIQKSFGTLQILGGVDFSAESGEMVSIIGKSGAGKTTLLHILGTLDRADGGSLRIENTEISKLSARDLAAFRNEKIGLTIPALIGKKNKRQAEKKATELLEYLGLGHRLTHKPDQLSGGEQQRVAVARALVNQPVVVFADEPTGNLDSNTSSDLHNLFLQLKKDFGQTFVIVTHNNELAKLSDRIIEMSDGKILV